MNSYTIFCQQTTGEGTIWIQSVEAADIDAAREEGRLQCSFDWEYDPEDVHVLGIAEGNITILEWDDLNV